MQRMIRTAAAALLLLGCADQPSEPETFLVPVFSNGASANANGGNFGTSMTAAEEVMPAGVVNNSRAHGTAMFQLSRDGESMTFQLVVANIENVTMAHIHSGAAGANGPPVVWLYPTVASRAPGPAGGGRVQGVISRDGFTAADFVGPLAGADMDALVDLLRAGGAYVNVHTNDGVAPSDTGPGDFPGGEIRGQIRARGN